MKPEEIESIQNEISTKIRLPKEERNKIYGKIFYNLLLAVGVLIYFIFLNLGYLKLQVDVFKNDLKVFAIILLGFTIYFMEKAYKADRGTYVVHSIELLVLSIITLYMPYVYFYHNTTAKFLFTTSSVYLAIYYTIKSICIYIIYKYRYMHGVSDVREIIKEDEPDYLDEDSRKIVEEKKIEEENQEDFANDEKEAKDDENKIEKRDDEKIKNEEELDTKKDVEKIEDKEKDEKTESTTKVDDYENIE